ncbi:MAG: thioredoxin family protein [Spirochaetaceae bacterium]
MKRAFACVLFALLTAAIGLGQDIYDWETDLEAGLEQAAEKEKHVLLYFAGSDWCGWCIRLKDEVLETRRFREFSEQNLVPVLIDFPRTRRQPEEQQEYNRELAERYEVEGFPTIYLLTPEEEVVLETGYRQGGPTNYVEHLRQALEQ